MLCTICAAPSNQTRSICHWSALGPVNGGSRITLPLGGQEPLLTLSRCTGTLRPRSSHIVSEIKLFMNMKAQDEMVQSQTRRLEAFVFQRSLKLPNPTGPGTSISRYHNLPTACPRGLSALQLGNSAEPSTSTSAYSLGGSVTDGATAITLNQALTAYFSTTQAHPS